MTNLEAAISYYNHGLSVVPAHSIDGDGICTCTKVDCSSPGKHPRIGWGQYQKERAHDGQIRTWWRRWPDANIAIATGKVSSCIVLDVDPRHGGDDSLRDLGQMPPTWTVLTGGGGQHLYFAHPGGTVANGANLLPGIDIRGDGGYVIAPPSNHVSGDRYMWEVGYGPNDGGKPLPMPQSVVSLLASGRTTPYVNGAAPSEAIDIMDYITGKRRLKYGSRNHEMAAIAGHVLGRGIPPDIALGVLWNIAQQAETDEHGERFSFKETQDVLYSINKRESAKQAAMAALEQSTTLDTLDRMPDDERRDLARACWLKLPLGVPHVVDWVRLVGVDSVDYQLELPDRVVSLGSGLLSGFGRIRDVVLNATGVGIPHMKSDTWDKYAVMLARLAREDQIGPLRQSEYVAEWMEELAKIAQDVDIDGRFTALQSGVIHYEGAIAMRPQRLLRWVKMYTGDDKLTPRDMGHSLRVSGWEYTKVRCSEKATVQVWLSPKLENSPLYTP